MLLEGFEEFVNMKCGLLITAVWAMVHGFFYLFFFALLLISDVHILFISISFVAQVMTQQLVNRVHTFHILMKKA